MLLSSQYTEAVRDVNRKLDDISDTVNSIASNQRYTQSIEQVHYGGRISSASPLLPTAIPHCSLDNRDGTKQFRGPPSFEAHAAQLIDWIRKFYVVEELPHNLFTAPQPPKASSPHHDLRRTDNGPNSCDKNTLNYINKPALTQYDERSLLPQDNTLGLMRLMHVEQQRFFVDTPIIS